MKSLTLLGLLVTSCSVDTGDRAAALAQAVDERAEVHAAFEDARLERQGQLALGGVQRGAKCKQLNVPLSIIDPDRSLFVHDKATLDGADFSLRRTLQTLAEQAINSGADAATTTPESLFLSMWETQVATLPDTTCPDATGLLNGFPYDCRPEGVIVDAAAEIDTWFPIALVNRMDNTSDDWSDCGEHRIVYARTPDLKKRNFIIFEGVVPNPSQGCKEGCRPIARWWADLSDEDDPLVRAGLLEDLYFRPLGRGPKGYQAVVLFDHYSIAGVNKPNIVAKGGQIRTNQRFMAPWQMKQYKTVLDCAVLPCVAEVVPVAVGVNPFPSLFSTAEEFTGQPWSSLVPSFQADFLAQRDVLATGTSAVDFTYEADPLFDAGQSTVDPTGDYLTSADTAFLTEVETGGPVGFTKEQLVNRATALSCAGCHDPSRFGLTLADSIAPGLSFPDSLRFVHTNDVVESVLPTTTVFGTGDGFALSPALEDELLPMRANIFLDLLNQPVCICQPPAALLSRNGRNEADAMARSVSNELDHAIADYARVAAENEVFAEAGIPVDRSTERAALDAVDAVMRASNDAMYGLLASEGVAFERQMDNGLVGGATPFRTSPVDDLATAVQEAVNSVPPRKTITGSFNTH